MSDTDPVREVAALREGLAVARRAILKAAQDTLWSDDVPCETVIDRIDALLAEADGQARLPLQRGSLIFDASTGRFARMVSHPFQEPSA